jgi:hypothetical protein
MFQHVPGDRRAPIRHVGRDLNSKFLAKKAGGRFRFALGAVFHRIVERDHGRP